MDITSFEYLIFVAAAFLIYWKLAQKYRWVFLLMISVVLYCLNAAPFTILYVICSVVTVYGATIYFEREHASSLNAPRKKKIVLTVTLCINVGILAVIKYSNLFVRTWNQLIGVRVSLLPELNFLAPMAISFYTLQLIAYLLDCYWDMVKPEKNILKLALFTIYFPQMISGPISRFDQLEKQLGGGNRSFNYGCTIHGLKRIAWGMMKKLAISNRVAVIVNEIWADRITFSGFYVWIAALLFVIQLYTDFSGCMDIIIGVSECFGIELVENFRAPLFSKTSQEFWRRWHITLGQWLRDYIMNPLAKSDAMVRLADRCKKKFGKKKGKQIPVFLSMLALWLCMGLWHGDSWKYVLGEGIWFWLVIVSGQMLKDSFARVKMWLRIREESLSWKAFQVMRTWLIVAVGLLFFRADSLMDAFLRIADSIKMDFSIPTAMAFARLCLSEQVGGKFGLILMGVSMALVGLVDYCIYTQNTKLFSCLEKHTIIRWLGYYAVVMIIMLSKNGGAQEFLYAQF